MNLTNAILVGLGLVGLIALMLAHMSTGSLEACVATYHSESTCLYALR